MQRFEGPLRDEAILPADIIVAIFSNLQQIIHINQELVHHLTNLSVGEAFLKLGPFLKLYSTYAKNHERALAVLMVRPGHVVLSVGQGIGLLVNSEFKMAAILNFGEGGIHFACSDKYQEQKE